MHSMKNTRWRLSEKELSRDGNGVSTGNKMEFLAREKFRNIENMTHSPALSHFMLDTQRSSPTSRLCHREGRGSVVAFTFFLA